MREDPENQSFTVTKAPPLRPRQVRGLRNIIVGTQLMMCNQNGNRTTIKIEGRPFKNKELNSWWVKISYPDKPLRGKVEISLPDHGVCQYNRGGWNTHNWLEKPE